MPSGRARVAISGDDAEIELRAYARELEVPYELLLETAQLGRLPVVNFAAGGVATPADAALMMQLGCDGVDAAAVDDADRLVSQMPDKDKLAQRGW